MINPDGGDGYDGEGGMGSGDEADAGGMPDGRFSKSDRDDGGGGGSDDDGMMKLEQDGGGALNSSLAGGEAAEGVLVEGEGEGKAQVEFLPADTTAAAAAAAASAGTSGGARSVLERISRPYMTRYERARVLGTRALQLSLNAPPMVDIAAAVESDPLRIAMLELQAQQCPVIIRRYLPDGARVLARPPAGSLAMASGAFSPSSTDLLTRSSSAQFPSHSTQLNSPLLYLHLHLCLQTARHV